MPTTLVQYTTHRRDDPIRVITKYFLEKVKLVRLFIKTSPSLTLQEAANGIFRTFCRKDLLKSNARLLYYLFVKKSEQTANIAFLQ